MSRSYAGKRITWPRVTHKHLNGEVWGRSDYTIGPGGKVYPRAGGEPVGGPGSKKWAKQEAVRFRRREFLRELRLKVLCAYIWSDD